MKPPAYSGRLLILFSLKLLTLAGAIAGSLFISEKAKANRTVQSYPIQQTSVQPTVQSTSKQATLKQSAPKQFIFNQQPPSTAPTQRGSACPEDPTTLTAMLLRDIPNYTNRVLQRTTAVLPWTEADQRRATAGELVRQPYRPSHVIVAGQADLTPLDLAPYTYTTNPEAGGPLTQIFFTTLSRQYWDLRPEQVRAEQIQEYHWVFLTQTSDGWRLAFMFSEIDRPQSEPSPIPPRESSQSSVGQALQTWLRDCRAGVLDAPDQENIGQENIEQDRTKQGKNRTTY